MALKITDTRLKTQPPPASGDMLTWDTEIKSFGVRIFAPMVQHPNGARTFS